MSDPRYACAVCYRVLDHVAGAGWCHTQLDRKDEDHPAVPVPADEITVHARCDFCSTDGVTHELVSVRIGSKVFGGAPVPASTYDEKWACCPACATDILHDEWGAVLERSLQLAPAELRHSPEVRAAVKALHDAVRSGMCEGPVRVHQ